MNKRFLLLITLFPLISLSQNNDIEFWNKTGVEIDLKKGFRTSIENHYRIHDTLKELKSIIPDLGLSYRINDNFRISANYRLYLDYNDDIVDFPDTNRFEKSHRYTFDLSIKQKINPIVMSHRLRYQNYFNSFTDNLISEPYFRNRLKVSYEEYEYVAPFISYETFLNLKKRNSILDVFRLTLGFSTEFKNHEFTLFTRYQRSIGNKITQNNYKYVFGINYCYSL